MPKNAVFFRIKMQKLPQRNPRLPPAVGGSAPQTPTLLLLLTIVSMSSSFIALNAFYYPKKKINK